MFAGETEPFLRSDCVDGRLFHKERLKERKIKKPLTS